MSTAYKWADPRAVGGGTVQSKAKERTELAKKMAEYIEKNGPIETTPTIVREPQKTLIQNSDKKKSRRALTALQQKTLNLLRQGYKSINEISKEIGTSNGNIAYTMDRLRERGLAEKIEKGNYRAVSHVENC